MDFPEKLDVLMELFSISNSKLARQLSIDPSLVSKWRHANRLPARNATYTKEMVLYFYQLYYDADAMIQHRLRRILGESAELHLDDSEMQLKQLLLEWLNPDGEIPIRENKNGGGPQNRQVLEMMQQLLMAETVSDGSGPVLPEKDAVAGGHQRSYHLHAGKEGRRKAVLEFLDLVLSMKQPQEILLMSQEDLAWMTENRAFLEEWNKKLLAVLTSGHQVTIIHHMDRQEEDLFSIMRYWIPMHLTGNVRSWYYPKYREMIIKNTFFIIRNHAAIYSTLGNDNDDRNHYTFFYRDPLVAQIMENTYQHFLEECIPLVQFYTANRLDMYMKHVMEIEEEPGTWIGWKTGLSSSCLSVSLYEQLLNQLDLDGVQRWKRLQMQQRRLDAFRQNIQHFSCIEVLPLALLNRLVRGGQALLEPLDSFTPHSLVLSSEQLVQLLESMVDRLKQHPKYEVYLANTNPLWQNMDMSLGYKENKAATAGSMGPNSNRPVAMVTGEGNMTQVFEGFFETSLSSISGNYRNRQRVIEKLQKVIAHHRTMAKKSWNQA